jgi:AcrR family transcriptional regulator
MADTELTDAPPSTVAGSSPWPARGTRSRDREIKREAVIRAAASAFHAHGYHNTSIDRIAAMLNVSKPTIYYYVANKEQLLFECFVAGLERIRGAIRRSQSSERPARERLDEVIRDYALAIASEYGWCMVRAEDLDLSAEMSRKIKLLKSEIDQGIRRLLREGMRDGSIEPCDPRMTAFALAGALNWIAHWYREDRSMSAPQIAGAFVEVFAAGLRPRTAASRAPRATSRATPRLRRTRSAR